MLEGTVPKDYPEPGLFFQSMGFVDKDGNGIRYEALYINQVHGLRLAPVPPVRRAAPGNPLPDTAPPGTSGRCYNRSSYAEGAMTRRIALAVSFGVLVSSISLLAHHSAASAYDVDKKITLRGTVTKLEWQNPQSSIT